MPPIYAFVLVGKFQSSLHTLYKYKPLSSKQYSVHCTVHCILYITINSKQASKWLAELTYSMRNSHIPALCTWQLSHVQCILY